MNGKRSKYKMASDTDYMYIYMCVHRNKKSQDDGMTKGSMQVTVLKTLHKP